MFPAGVLIDDHGLSKAEVHTLGKALSVYVHLSLGHLDKLAPHLGILFGTELSSEPERLERIKELAGELNSLLWEGREPWSIYSDGERGSHTGLLAYNLAQRLLRNEAEIVKSSHKIGIVRKMNENPFDISGESNDRYEDCPEEDDQQEAH
jgi:hypothetical protein